MTKFQEVSLFTATVCCLALTMLPSFGLVNSQDDILANENRQMAAFPSHATIVDWKAFPQAFEAYFSDHQAFRQVLTKAHHQALVMLFKRSPSRKVLIAEDGWLFLQGPGGDAVDLYYRNIKPFSSQEIEDIHAEMVRRRDWVGSWGGRALFVLVPNKETIYPERLPWFYQRQASPVSRYAQWEEIFAEDRSLVRVELKPVLERAKQQGQVYFRSDSHWNADGAYVGYRELLSLLEQWFPIISPVGRMKKLAPTFYQGDLARMLLVGSWFDELDLPCASSSQGGDRLVCAKSIHPSSGGILIPQKSEPIVFECDNNQLPTAVLIRDSMAIPWLAWIPDNFRRLVVMSNWFPSAEVIERERPDVVIFEFVERSMEQYLNVTLAIDPISKRPSFSWER